MPQLFVFADSLRLRLAWAALLERVLLVLENARRTSDQRGDATTRRRLEFFASRQRYT